MHFCQLQNPWHSLEDMATGIWPQLQLSLGINSVIVFLYSALGFGFLFFFLYDFNSIVIPFQKSIFNLIAFTAHQATLYKKNFSFAPETLLFKSFSHSLKSLFSNFFLGPQLFTLIFFFLWIFKNMFSIKDVPVNSWVAFCPLQEKNVFILHY